MVAVPFFFAFITPFFRNGCYLLIGGGVKSPLSCEVIEK